MLAILFSVLVIDIDYIRWSGRKCHNLVGGNIPYANDAQAIFDATLIYEHINRKLNPFR